MASTRRAAGDEGHFGLQMLADLVRDAEGELEVESSPGRRCAGRGRGGEVIRVLLAEDHRLVRAGLERLLATPTTSRWSAAPPTGRRPLPRRRSRSGRRSDGPLDAQRRRDRGDARDPRGERRGAGRRADVARRPRPHPRGARRRRDRLPPQGLGARGADRGRAGRGSRRVAARPEGGAHRPQRPRRQRARRIDRARARSALAASRTGCRTS